VPIPLPILPQLPGPFQIVRSVNYPSIPIAGQLLIPQLLRLGTGRTPGRRQTLILSKAEVSPSNLLGSSLTGIPRGAQSLFNCPRISYEVHQSGSRTGPSGVAPSFPSRGECIPMLKWGDTAPETLQQLKFCSHPWDHKTKSCFQGGNRIPESTHELLSCYSTLCLIIIIPSFPPPSGRIRRTVSPIGQCPYFSGACPPCPSVWLRGTIFTAGFPAVGMGRVVS